MATKEQKKREVADWEIEKFLRDVQTEEREALKKCIHAQIAVMGYVPKTVREGGRTWERAEREVARGLIQNELRLRDIEFGEE